MNATKTPAKFDWSAPDNQSLVLLIAIIVVGADMPEPLPFWPNIWGEAPSVGAALLVVALGVLISRLARGERRVKAAGELAD